MSSKARKRVNQACRDKLKAAASARRAVRVPPMLAPERDILGLTSETLPTHTTRLNAMVALARLLGLGKAGAS